MAKQRNYRVVPFTSNRRVMVASVSVAHEQNNIQMITEVDVTTPRRLLREHRDHTGERLSFTGYIITCLARAVSKHPGVNSFRRGGKLILLDDVTISALVERELEGEQMPEPVGIHAAQMKTYRQIHDEIRAAQAHEGESLGDLSGVTWVRFIPPFLMRTFVRFAAHNVAMVSRYGAIGVTAVGMFGNDALWLLPLSGGTVAVAVGSIVERPALIEGRLGNHEYLCLTLTFNHDIIDGAPAARFIRTFSELLSSGDLVRETIDV